MDEVIDQVPEAISRVFEREIQIVREAIALVASGASRRVIVAGLCQSRQLLDPARRLAAEAGVRLVPLWRSNVPGVDIAIERDSDDPTCGGSSLADRITSDLPVER